MAGKSMDGVVTDYKAFAETQREMYGRVASFGAIGGLLGLGLGNYLHFNVVATGLIGFVVGAAVGKAVHNRNQQAENRKRQSNEKEQQQP